MTQRVDRAGAGTVSDTFSVALILVDINRLRDVDQWYGKNTGDEVLKRLSTIITQPLRDVDHAVRLQDDDILLILPGLTGDQATRMAYSCCADVATMRLHEVSAPGGVTATAAVTTPRERPLPIAALGRAIAQAKAGRLSVIQLVDGTATTVPGATAGPGERGDAPLIDLQPVAGRGARAADGAGPAAPNGRPQVPTSVMFPDSTPAAAAAT